MEGMQMKRFLILVMTLLLLPVQVLAATNQTLPATGDNSPILPVVILMLLSAAGIAVMVVLARSNRGK